MKSEKLMALLAIWLSLGSSYTVFISMVNFTLARCDSYLDHLQSGIKQDTLNALRTACLNMDTLFLDNILKRAEDNILHFESKSYSGSSSHKKGRYHPYVRQQKSSKDTSWSDRLAWKNLGHGHKKVWGKTSSHTS